MLCDLLLGHDDEVELIGRGLERAARLARHLRRLPISGLRSSRRRRPIHTATLIGEQLALSIRIAQSLNEVDYGRWSGAALRNSRRFSSCSFLPGHPCGHFRGWPAFWPSSNTLLTCFTGRETHDHCPITIRHTSVLYVE